MKSSSRAPSGRRPAWCHEKTSGSAPAGRVPAHGSGSPYPEQASGVELPPSRRTSTRSAVRPPARAGYLPASRRPARCAVPTTARAPCATVKGATTTCGRSKSLLPATSRTPHRLVQPRRPKGPREQASGEQCPTRKAIQWHRRTPPQRGNHEVPPPARAPEERRSVLRAPPSRQRREAMVPGHENRGRHIGSPAPCSGGLSRIRSHNAASAATLRPSRWESATRPADPSS